jgi:hypothetical protein
LWILIIVLLWGFYEMYEINVTCDVMWYVEIVIWKYVAIFVIEYWFKACKICDWIWMRKEKKRKDMKGNERKRKRKWKRAHGGENINMRHMYRVSRPVQMLHHICTGCFVPVQYPVQMRVMNLQILVFLVVGGEWYTTQNFTRCDNLSSSWGQKEKKRYDPKCLCIIQWSMMVWANRTKDQKLIT